MESSSEHVSEVYNLIMAGWGSQAVRALSYLSVAEHLRNGPLPASDIAARESTDPGATFRLLRAGAAMGLVGYHAESGTFFSTAALQVLHGEDASSLKHYARAAVGPAFWHPAVRLPDAVRDGRPQTQAALGTDTFTYLGEHPDQAAEFGLAMTGLSGPVIRRAADLIRPRGARTVVDVGGAEGAFAAELLSRHPRLTALVLELPSQVGAIEAEAARRSLADRLDAVPGDFFDAVPEGNLYLLKFILHDWDDESSVLILSRIRSAMPTGSRLYVVEMLSSGSQVPAGLAYMDMAMLFALGGQERDLAAYDRLFGLAGLRRTGVIDLLEPYVAIEVMADRPDA